MATDHDPATCEICHEQGMDAEVEALKAERDRYRRALIYAVEAFEKAGDTHHCDYCRADAAAIYRALDGADIMPPPDLCAASNDHQTPQEGTP